MKGEGERDGTVLGAFSSKQYNANGVGVEKGRTTMRIGSWKSMLIEVDVAALIRHAWRIPD